MFIMIKLQNMSSKAILLIGNTGNNKSLNGQTIKVRLYKDILSKENIDFTFVDLCRFKHHPFSTLKKIRNGIKTCNRIVLISAQRGTKFLIPFINRHNKKYNKPFILPMIGVNILHKYIDPLSESDHYEFMHDCNFKNVRPKRKDIKNLSKITWILPENEAIKNVICKFFGLRNVGILENFRDIENIPRREKKHNGLLNIVFLSRITKNKGIFELIHAVKTINEKNIRIKLDIYGEFYFEKKDEEYFFSLLDKNICYIGPVNNSLVIETISAYDLFVFPTLFKSEGTPGVIAESFIAGVPVLSAEFAQAETLMKNNYNSIIYSPSTSERLEKSLLSLLHNNKLKQLSENIKKDNAKYLYNYNRGYFLFYVCGYGQLGSKDDKNE